MRTFATKLWRWHGPWLAMLWLVAAVAAAEQQIPPVAPVVDLTGTLSQAQHVELTQRLVQFSTKKGSQIAVLVVPTTAPEPIRQYALRVAETWQLGRAGVDDGVLLLVATKDRQLNIEVGYGLEGAIPDAIAKRVVSDVIAPKFKQGDFSGGISSGVDSLIGLVEGEPLPEPEWSERIGAGDDGDSSSLIPLLFFAFPFLPMLGRRSGRLPAALIGGGVMGAVGYFMIGIIGALMFGIFAFIVILNTRAGIGHGAPRRRRRGGHHGGFGGVFTGGGSSTGGFGGGGGGGFGGGGGGFGGGGASGSW